MKKVKMKITMDIEVEFGEEISEDELLDDIDFNASFHYVDATIISNEIDVDVIGGGEMSCRLA